MEAAIARELGLRAELIEGGGGVFDVSADATLLYSKHRTGRFPEHERIVALLRERMR
ncbi:MAG: Rdx family protein [Burkholderiales bacterium]|nr:Rdx family protein [Burkholderiales bacterium]